MGQTTLNAPLASFCRLLFRNGEAVDEADGAISEDGNVMGSYLHGLFDEGPFARTLLNRLRQRKGWILWNRTAALRLLKSVNTIG